ncbi:MAG: hypothetical protein HYW24_00045 [Candidatus Aenigmarchaeota archaeon]|nr:hypothetical protein [Candidatus Aenigmarchaeota archaeon]
MLTKEKAEILGLLCAEGTHYEYVSVETKFDKRRGKYYTHSRIREQIEFGNLNKLLLKHFQYLLINVYKYPTKITGIPTSLKIHITKKDIMKDLLKYTDFNSDRWSVPNEVLTGSLEIKAAFIRGLYEGDGTKLQFANKTTPYVDFHMKNPTGLDSVAILLKSLGVNTRFWKSDYGRLVIYGLDDVRKFSRTIKPIFKRIKLNTN